MIPSSLISEAVIQAEFYTQSKLIGLNCTLELSTPKGRLDIGIMSPCWTSLVAIVEVKRGVGMFRRSQISRYKEIGVPVFGLERIGRAAGLASQIKRDYSKSAGVALYDIMSMSRFYRPRRRQ